jgi:Putative beta-barrel porin-2, OmpL-like. bbp2
MKFFYFFMISVLCLSKAEAQVSLSYTYSGEVTYLRHFSDEVSKGYFPNWLNGNLATRRLHTNFNYAGFTLKDERNRFKINTAAVIGSYSWIRSRSNEYNEILPIEVNIDLKLTNLLSIDAGLLPFNYRHDEIVQYKNMHATRSLIDQSTYNNFVGVRAHFQPANSDWSYNAFVSNAELGPVDRSGFDVFHQGGLSAKKGDRDSTFTFQTTLLFGYYDSIQINSTDKFFLYNITWAAFRPSEKVKLFMSLDAGYRGFDSASIIKSGSMIGVQGGVSYKIADKLIMAYRAQWIDDPQVQFIPVNGFDVSYKIEDIATMRALMHNITLDWQFHEKAKVRLEGGYFSATEKMINFSSAVSSSAPVTNLLPFAQLTLSSRFSDSFRLKD